VAALLLGGLGAIALLRGGAEPGTPIAEGTPDVPEPLLPPETPPPDPELPRPDAIDPSEELLAYLDVLENWELLHDENLDVMLASLDPADEVLLALEEDGLAPDWGVAEGEAR